MTVIAPEAITASEGAYCDSIESDVAVQSETLVILIDGDASLRYPLLHRGGVGSVPVSSAFDSENESRSNNSKDELPKKKKKKKKNVV